MRPGSLIAPLLLLLASPAAAESFDFALVGDPQMGYGVNGPGADAGRFRKIVDDIDRRGVPLTLIPGDLTESRSWWQRRTFDAEVARLGGRVLLTAGNHDVEDEASLAAFRERWGPDHQDLVQGGVAFVLVDSETARTPDISRAEFEAQWSFLERALAEHQAAGRRIVLVTHRPPFVEREDEPDDFGNWPRDTRARLLALLRRHGVHLVLSGHLHRTVTAQTADGIRVVVPAGSARSFDRSELKYALFHVRDDGIREEWVVVGPPVRRPYHVPHVPEWTPRLLDFDLRHWLFTLAYGLVGAVALRTARAGSEGRRSPWFVVALLLFFFGANMQLDLDEALQGGGRILARLAGVYELRHVLTGAAAAVVVLASGTALGVSLRRATRQRPLVIAVAALGIPTAWFCLSAISNHVLGMLFEEIYWDALTVAALATIAVCARSAVRAG